MLSHYKLVNTLLPLPNKPFALFLDVDGTISRIAGTPSQAVIEPELLVYLSKLKTRLAGALALVSGRNIESVDKMCENLKFTVAGQHGLELRRDGEQTIFNAENYKIINEIYEQINAFHQDYPNLLIEYKGLAIAVHYRNAPELEDTLRALMFELAAPYDREINLTEGKMVIEIKLRGADKGSAIQQLMSRAPFAGKFPVFVGDDVTDEDGFKMVNKIGGMSIKVGSGKTTAKYYAKDISEIEEWLGSMIGE